MAPNTPERPWTTEVYDGFTSAIKFFLAGLAGGVDEFTLLSITLQQTDYGDFRCVLRGVSRTGANIGVGLVAFTNAETPAECYLYAHKAFAEGTIRWHVDKWAKDAASNGSAKTPAVQLTMDDSIRL